MWDSLGQGQEDYNLVDMQNGDKDVLTMGIFYRPVGDNGGGEGERSKMKRSCGVCSRSSYGHKEFR